MEMTNGEIVANYRQAKNKSEQVKILADLNTCPIEQIISILTSAGIDHRHFTGLRRQLNKEFIESQKKNEQSERSEILQNTPLQNRSESADIAPALSAVVSRVAELIKRKRDIEDELADISVQLNRIDDIIAGRE